MITIYGAPWCGFCERAKALAEQYDLQYTYINVDIKSNQTLFREQFPDAKSIPQIIWNEEHIGGYDEFAAEVVMREVHDGTVKPI